jgi:hypothetical protein
MWVEYHAIVYHSHVIDKHKRSGSGSGYIGDMIGRKIFTIYTYILCNDRCPHGHTLKHRGDMTDQVTFFRSQVTSQQSNEQKSTGGTKRTSRDTRL